MSWLRFYPDVILKKGYVNSTLYFLGEKKTIVLTTRESELLNYLLEHSVEEAKTVFGTDLVECAIDKVLESGMGNLYDSKVFAEKYKPNIDFLVEQFFQDRFGIYEFCIQLPVLYNSEYRAPKGVLVHEGCNSYLVPDIDILEVTSYRQLLYNNLKLIHGVSVNHFTIQGGNPSDNWELVMELLQEIQEGFGCMTELVFPNVPISRENINQLKKYNVLLKLSLYAEEITDRDEVFVNNVNTLIHEDMDVKVNVIYHSKSYVQPDAVNDVLRGFGIENVDCTHLIYSPKDKLIALSTNTNRVENIGPDSYYSKRSCMQGRIAITADGFIRPCSFNSHVIGYLCHGIMTVFEKDFHTKYWRHSKDDVNRCKGCENRFACIDCASLEEYINQDNKYLSVLCNYNPEEGVWSDECIREEDFAW